MNIGLTLLAVLWMLFGVSHSILAHSRVKSSLSRIFSLSQTSYKVFYNFFAFFFLTGLLYLQVVIQSTLLFRQTNFTLLLCIIFAAGGAIVMLMAVVKYFKQLSGFFKESKTPRLETHGLHQYVRHPLYFGTIFFVVGLFMCFPYLKNAIAGFIIIAYTLVGAHFEEQKLVKLFGQQYLTYRKKVPMIIPRIWRNKQGK